MTHEVRRVGRQELGRSTIEALRAHAADGPDVLVDLAWAALDHAEGRPSYASYIGTRSLDAAVVAAGSVSAARGHLVAAALGRELEALEHGAAGPGIEATERRVAALAQHLRRETGWVAVPALAVLADRRPQGREGWPERALGAAAELAAHRRRSTSAALAVRLDVLDLPMTTVADERLFLRAVQALELSFDRWVADLDRAARSAASGHLVEAAGVVRLVATDLAGSRLLLRALASLGPGDFAAIRTATQGASAIQSAGYRAFLLRCTAAPDGVAAQAANGRAEAAPGGDQLVAALRDLDDEHRRWMRLHVSLARQLIGDAPGTGGTTGVSYLRSRAGLRLFPSLGTWPAGPAPGAEVSGHD